MREGKKRANKAEKKVQQKQKRQGITVEIPGYQKLQLQYLILDYNGTIALDGKLQEGVAECLKQLSDQLEIYIVTADTHGTVRRLCQGLPVQIYTFPTEKAAEEKRKIVEMLGADRCICAGNGRNDLEMCRIAGLSVAVMEQEGMYGRLGAEADICVRSITEGLDLILNEKRLIATLRG